MVCCLAAAAGLLVLAGCSKADDGIGIDSMPERQAVPAPALKVLVRTSGSRATVAADAVTWTVNDKIFGFYEKNGTRRQVAFQYKGQTEGDCVVFELTSGTVTEATDGTAFHMVYAPGREDGMTADGKLALSLAGQTGSLSGMGAFNYMYASGSVVGNTLTLSFENQIALLKLHSLDFADAVSTICVSGGQITDEATFDLQTGSWTLGEPATLTINGTFEKEKDNDIYIALFPCTSKVFVNLKEGSSHHDRSVVTDKAFERGRMYGLDCSTEKCAADNKKWTTDNTIYTAGQWCDFVSGISTSNKYAGKTIKIGADITLFDGWSCGTFADFRGTLDGQGHTITLAGAANGPLLNEIGTATVRNLTVAGKVNKPYVSGGTSYTGGLVGLMKLSDSDTSRAVLEGCTNKASVASSVATNSFVGGLAGKAEKNALIKDSTNEGDVTCSDNAASINVMVGGIAGQVNGTIADCRNSGNVTVGTTCSNLYVGGIAGVAYGNATYTSTVQGCSTDSGHTIQVTNNSKEAEMRVGGIVGNGFGNLYGCANYSNVSTQGNAKVLLLGGISGLVGNTGITLSMQCCHNRGNVTNTATASDNSNVGGFAGKLNLGTISITGTYSVAQSISDTSSTPKTGKHTGTFVGIVNLYATDITLQDCFVTAVTEKLEWAGEKKDDFKPKPNDITNAEMQTQETASLLNGHLSGDCGYRFAYRAGDYPAIEKKPFPSTRLRASWAQDK